MKIRKIGRGPGWCRAWAGLLLLCAAVAHAQTTASVVVQETELQHVLKKLGEAALELEKSLPSFTCEESVVSQEMRGARARWGTMATMTLRAQKEPNGELKESFSYTSVGGKPFTQGVVKIPVYVAGGFGNALRYFHPDQQRCYAFALSPRRIDFKTIPNGLAQGCKETGLVGFARLDADGNVTYLERTVPAKVARPLWLATFAAITFAPVTMGEKTYRLSSHMLAELSLGKSVGRFDATYTNCRLFKSTVTIGPAVVLPDDPSASKP